MEQQSKYLVIFDNAGQEIYRFAVPKFFHGAFEYAWAVRMFRNKRKNNKDIDHWDWEIP
jgi:hypothetical protein